MNKEQIIEQLTGIMRPYVTASDTEHALALNGNEHLVNDLRVDSVDIIEIILDIEKVFEIQVEDNELRKLATVNDLAELIGVKTK